MSKPDWAFTKASKTLGRKDAYAHLFAQLLRAERAACQRKIRNLKVDANRPGKEKLIYFEAIDDCIAAIKGGSR